MTGLEGSIVVAARALGAGLCMGLGAIGPAIGEGNAVGKALEAMALPDISMRQYAFYRLS